MPGAPGQRQKARKRKWIAALEGHSIVPEKMTSSNDALSFLVGLTTDNSILESNAEEVMDADCGTVDAPEMQFPCASTTTSNSDNLVYFGDEFPFDAKDIETQKKVARQLEQLQFSNPGEHNKLPTKRGRPKRGQEKKNKPGAFHNKQGKLLMADQSVIICDCLDVDCGGCHSPCSDCKGRYCGPICQSSRPRYCAKVTTLGKAPVYNPYFAKR